MEKDIAINRVFDAVGKVTGVDRATIVSGSRDRDAHFARMIAVYHLRHQGFDYRKIRNLIGRNSESTVAYLLQAYSREQTPYFKACAEKVNQILHEKI